MLNIVTIIGNMVFPMEHSSFVRNTIEDLFNHNGLEDNDEDMQSREEVACLGNEFPFSSIVDAFNMFSILNSSSTITCHNDLSYTEDGIIDDEDLGLLSIRG